MLKSYSAVSVEFDCPLQLSCVWKFIYSTKCELHCVVFIVI